MYFCALEKLQNQMRLFISRSHVCEHIFRFGKRDVSELNSRCIVRNHITLTMSVLQLCNNVTACSYAPGNILPLLLSLQTYILRTHHVIEPGSRTIWIHCTCWSLTDATSTGVISHARVCACLDLVDSVISAYGTR